MISGHSARILAQGATTASIIGCIVDNSGRGLLGAEVVATNQETGISMRAISRADGNYLISGLDVGGPYSLTVRRIGSAMVRKTGLILSIDQQMQVNVVLDAEALMLQGVETIAAEDRLFSRTRTGIDALLSDSVLHEMPVMNRDLYDLVRLVPQMSTWFALAGSGAGPRVNSIRIDGVTDQVPSSNLAAGQLYGGKVIPLDAVKEYQVSLSPYDVRQGSFAGAGVDVVTRSGTNELRGSAFAYGTSERLGANVPFIRKAPYEKGQLGLSLGGPIVRNRLLFFISSELQRRSIPALGPYVGQPASSEVSLPVSPADIARFQHLLSARGLDAGSAGAVQNLNPSSSTFLRLDAPISRWNSRITLRASYGHADSSIFARPTMLAPTDCSGACFPLSSLQHSRWLDKQTASVQLVSNFANGAYNELVAGTMHLVTGFHPTVDEPLILVTVPGVDGAPAVLQAGTHEVATGQRNVSWTMEITDNLSFSAGAHRLTIGGSMQLFDLWAFQLWGAYGIWEFSSLDSLQAGIASRYRITRDTGSVTAASGAYPELHLGDEWHPSPRLSITLGVRANAPTVAARLPFVPTVDSVFHVRSDRVPSTVVQWSPRVGFNYDLTSEDNALTQLRGGVGIFTGRPPLFWLFGGFAAHGLATRTLQCGMLPGDAGAAPAFRTDFRDPPLSCAAGQTFGSSTTGEVDVIDRQLRSPQTLRASMAVDRELPFGIVGTIEGLYSRTTSSVFVAPMNLKPPTTTDRHGRLLYGTIGTSGTATPVRVAAQLGDVMSITNESKDHAYDLTSEVRKETESASVAVSFSYGHVYDVASPRTVSAFLTDNWRFGRTVAGDEKDLTLGTSDFDQPYRVRAYGTVRSPWRRFRTELSLFYVGGSGFPYTYVAGGTSGRGDLNADGAVGNDPIYIPRSASDPAEIQFAGSAADVATQQAAFDRFIAGSACLRKQRGRIMARNSCRSPWMNLTNVAIRQTFPSIGGQSLTAEIQVFNLLNLLNDRWGREKLPTGATLATTSQIPLLSQVGETAGPDLQPIYRFDAGMPRYSSEDLDSYYQIQLGLRYSF